MNARDLAELLALAALWGASFLFMRLGAGDFGPLPLTALRVTLAALALMPLLQLRGLWPSLRTYWRPMVVVGVVNSALPFAAYTYSLLTITTGLSSVFNATAPLWGALIAWLWLRDKPTPWRILGLAIGFAGVLWLAWDKIGLKADIDGKGTADGTRTALAVAACIAATFCYGFSANYTKRRLAGVPPLAVAAGSQMAAAVALALPAAWLWPAAVPPASSWLWAILLGVFCTGAAYLLYFRLIAHVGPARAISVTFLIPLFAVLWGWIFLGETIPPVMAGACAVIVLGTALASGLVAPRVKV